MTDRATEKAMKLALVTGLRAALGPALVARSKHRPDRQNLALAALGEMVYDKLPLVPSRDSALSLLVRGLAGAWVVQQCQEDEENPDPMLVPMGAAIAMGVALAAPKLRRALGWSTGVPQPILGLVEDYLALKLGSEAVGLSMGDVQTAANESVEFIKEHIPSMDAVREHLPAALQSAGAASM